MGVIEARLHTLRTGEALVVRTAEGDDAGELVRLARHVMSTSPHTLTQPDEFTLTEEEERKLLEEYAAHASRAFLVGAVEGRVVAALNFKAHERRRQAHHGHFGVGVAQAWRGRGIGRRLIVALLDWGADHPTLEKICLGVYETNTGARRLYAALGFVQEAVRVKEIRLGPGQYVDEIQMSVFVKPGIAPAGFTTYRKGMFA